MLKEYEDWVMTTSKVPGQIWYANLGLSGEAGELVEEALALNRSVSRVNEETKKFFRAETSDRKKKIILEAGDVLFYLTRLLQEVGSSLKEAAMENVSKVEARREINVVVG